MKILLVTGASSDIGAYLINRYIDKYDLVVGQYRRLNSELEKIKKNYKQKLYLIESDFSKEDNIINFTETLIKENLIPSDFIHLPAPKYRIKNFDKFLWEDYELNINISLKSAVLILQKLLPIIKKNKNGQVVFMLSSCVDGLPPKYISPYCVTKYALLGLMKQLSVEYKKDDISFYAISPDMIQTKFLSDIPRLIVEKNALNYKSGKNLAVDDLKNVFDDILINKNIENGANIILKNEE